MFFIEIVQLNGFSLSLCFEDINLQDNEVKFKEKPNEVLYFTNRLEIGFDSVYDKLETSSHVLNETHGLGGKKNEEGGRLSYAAEKAYDSVLSAGSRLKRGLTMDR